MATNQTIDGVPREAIAALEKARDVLRAVIRDKVAGVHYASAQAACHQIRGSIDELRALLDADKVNNRQMGLVQFVEAHPIKPVEERGSSHGFEQSPNTCRHDERAGVWWREGSVTRTGRECCACGNVEEDPVKTASQPQGKPVARVETGADRNAALTVTDDDWLRSLKDRGVHQIVSLYAEQPAPVAVVLPERKENRDSGPTLRKIPADGWNACLDELKRLNPSL